MGGKVLVAGATGGLGRVCAEILADEYPLLLWSRSDDVHSLAKFIRKGGGDADAKCVDIMSPDQYPRYGKLWGGVNFSAAQSSFVQIDRLGEAWWDSPAMGTWHQIINVDVWGSFLFAIHCAKGMQNGGRIILLSSFHGTVGSYSSIHPAYPTAKAAISGLTKRLALELAPRGITVNAIAPGPILTPRTMANADRGDIDLEAMKKRCPMGRLGTPEEVAALVRFLLSRGAGWITGQTIVMDGGWSLDLEAK